LTLSVINLKKTYLDGGRLQPVFSNLSFTLETGSFVSVIGPSGSGKSTLCNLIAGIEKPDEGTILLDGKDITGRPGNVGYMFQKDLLLPWRTLEENVILGCEIQGLKKRTALAEAKKGLKLFELEDFAHYYPSQLSGGMRQRGALLRTILFGRSTLLLDEPFGALDALTRTNMQAWLLTIWNKMQNTVLFITHDIEEALLLSDYILVLSKPPAEIVATNTVPFPRPRENELRFSPQMLALKKQLHQYLHQDKSHQ
jgi:putative hydroxymethylpyrimidine transport system ATP-binding protein